MSFAAAAVVGVAVDNSAATILLRATLVMMVGWVVGLVIGAIAQRTIDDHIAQYKSDHPIPSAQPGGAPPSSEDGGFTTEYEETASGVAAEGEQPPVREAA